MDKDAKTAIYSPPREGLPHLLVTVSRHGDISSIMPVASRDEARRIMIRGEQPLQLVAREIA